MGVFCALRRGTPEVDDSSTCYEECQMSSHTSCSQLMQPKDELASSCLVEHDHDHDACDVLGCDDDNTSCGTSVTMEDAEEQLADDDDDEEVGDGAKRLCEFKVESQEQEHVQEEQLSSSSGDVDFPASRSGAPTTNETTPAYVERDAEDIGEPHHDEQEPIPDLCCESNDDAGAAVAAATAAEIDSAMDAALEDEEKEDNDALFGTQEPTQATYSASAVFMEAPSRRYGGLLNLGNTCYMASALQMIATMEDFVENVRNHEPSSPDDEASVKLRNAFLDIMDRLRRGETVSPFRFKQIVDERSPLFVGYEQQDAHEFFTTLLDLIDEDFKKSPDPDESKPPPETSEPEESEETVAEPSFVSEQDDDLNLSLHVEEGECPLKSEPDCSRKKARTGEFSDPYESQRSVNGVEQGDSATAAAATAASPTTWLTATCRNSFSELNLDEIGHLLHDTNPSGDDSLALSSAVEPFVPARYKLVGGRMNTADVVLTPYATAVFTDDIPSVTAVARDDADALLSSSFGATTTTAAAATSGGAAATAPSLPSPVDNFFKLKARVRLTCDSCKYSRCHEESFLHLSLEIGPGCGSVDDGLRRFFSPETREIKCEKCFSESATQSMEIIELPRALVLHFKRFIVEVSSDYSSVSYRKNQSSVSIDPEMSLDAGAGSILTEFLAHDCEPSIRERSLLSYRLRSVVNHMGASASCGHYTADASREYDGGERRWTRFNDSIVTAISAMDAIERSQRTAYLALYELTE